MKVKEVVKLLEKDGWYLSRTRGSHRQYRYPYRTGLVTIAGKLSSEIAIRTLKSIYKQSGLL